MSDDKTKTPVDLNKKIDDAIVILLDQIRTNLRPEETLKQTQAVLNMAHAKSAFIMLELNKQQVRAEEEEKQRLIAREKEQPKK